MTSDLKTTTQLEFCDRSISKLANCGMETLGSLVQCNRSAIVQKKTKKNFNAINKTTTKMKIKQRNPDINYPFICFHPDFPHYYELKKKSTHVIVTGGSLRDGNRVTLTTGPISVLHVPV